MDKPTEANLPALISAVSPQKKNRQRYSIFAGGDFLMGVAAETLLEYDLAKGDQITVSFYRKLQRAEGRQAVKSYLLKLLSRRDHAPKELFDKARRKEYPADIVQGVIEELEAKGFINVSEFAKKFARDKYKLNDWGPYKIKAHLRKKGITQEVSEKAIDTAFQTVDFKEQFQNLIDKRRRHFMREEDPFKRKKKVADYLQRKGYRPSEIYNYLDDLIEKLK